MNNKTIKIWLIILTIITFWNIFGWQIEELIHPMASWGLCDRPSPSGGIAIVRGQRDWGFDWWNLQIRYSTICNDISK